MNNKSPGKPFY